MSIISQLKHAARTLASLRPVTVSILASVVSWTQAVHGQVTFTPVVGVPPTSEGGKSLGNAWGDFDGDGRLDLCVANQGTGNFLYQNNGGTFAKVTTGPLVTDIMSSSGCGWADYDNDGRLDLIVLNVAQDNVLYRGTSEGGFARAFTFANRSEAYAGAWGDYDQDGFVDLFIARTSGGSQLWHNQRDGTFTLVDTGVMASIAGAAIAASWCDYDKDGRLDLFVATGARQPDLLYHNEGDSFKKITTGAIVTKLGESQSAAWGDYDGDGWFDLFVANRDVGDRKGNFLYHNNQDGTFTEVTTGPVVTDVANSNGCTWGDYDNDGWLDLFVANGTGQEHNFLYHNNGDGTFSRVTTGSIVTDTGFSIGCSWVDYDNDGNLDMFVTRYGGGKNALYRNNGTSNAWLKVRLTGSASNRSGIGAVVSVRATIKGVSRWQVRQITGNASFAGQELVAHFGLGDAGSVDMVRVQWPSGAVSEVSGQNVGQSLAITEPGLPAIQFNPAGGDFIGSASVTLKNNLGTGAILYTTDGSEPTLSSTPYVNPIVVQRTTTVRARVFFNGFPISAVFAATFTRSPDILFVPPAGLFTNWVDVALQNTVGTGLLRYTVDGTPPTAQSPTYSLPIRLTVATTIKAEIFIDGFPASEVYTAEYLRVYALDDGIPASWREQYFGPGYLTDPRAAADADPDNDGSNNAQEYAAGTNPMDPLSGFKVEVRAVPLLTWASVVGQKYRILRKPVVTDPTWTTVVDNYIATNTVSKYADVDAEGTQFYVIQVVQ